MTSPVCPDTPGEQLACYLAGALPIQEEREVLRRLNTDWPEGEAALREYEEGLLALAHSIPEVQPPGALKVEILLMLPVQKQADATTSQPPAGITFRLHAQDIFRPTSYPGISIRLLHLNHQARRFTALLKMEPGARYPDHHHDSEEECLVLEGSLMVGDHRMEAGDYQFCEAHSDHVEQWSETGALLYLTAPISLLK